MRYRVIFEDGCHKFAVEIEKTGQPLHGKAVFRILQPTSFPNIRLKIEESLVQDVLAVMGETFLLIARSGKVNFSKWTENFLGSKGRSAHSVEVFEVDSRGKQVEPEPEPEMSPLAMFYFSGEWRNVNATPPGERRFWKWYSVNNHWNIDSEVFYKDKECQEFANEIRRTREWLLAEKGWKG